MPYWTKFGHVIFLIALILSGINIILFDKKIAILAFVLLIAALVYDIYKTKKDVHKKVESFI